MHNLFKYSKFYSGKDPVFEEGDVFRIIVPLDDNYSFDMSIGLETIPDTIDTIPDTNREDFFEKNMM